MQEREREEEDGGVRKGGRECGEREREREREREKERERERERERDERKKREERYTIRDSAKLSVVRYWNFSK